MQVALRHANGDAVKLQETATLSMGTGQSVASTKLAQPNAGALQWVLANGPLTSILMESPSSIQSALGEYFMYKVNSSILPKAQHLTNKARALPLCGGVSVGTQSFPRVARAGFVNCALVGYLNTDSRQSHPDNALRCRALGCQQRSSFHYRHAR